MTSQPCAHEFHWYPATNEEGWMCCFCKHKPGEPPGYSPELDRSETYTKVWGLLMDLHNQKLVYVSNGSASDGISADVTARCKREGRYDQSSILLFILEGDAPSHAAYWKRIGDAIIEGRDQRPRCGCGRLSTWSIGNARGCDEHRTPKEAGNLPGI